MSLNAMDYLGQAKRDEIGATELGKTIMAKYGINKDFSELSEADRSHLLSMISVPVAIKLENNLGSSCLKEGIKIASQHQEGWKGKAKEEDVYDNLEPLEVLYIDLRYGKR